MQVYSDEFNDKYELYHHGVKGMHWGIRKERNNTSNNSFSGKFSDSIKRKRIVSQYNRELNTMKKKWEDDERNIDIKTMEEVSDALSEPMFDALEKKFGNFDDWNSRQEEFYQIAFEDMWSDMHIAKLSLNRNEFFEHDNDYKRIVDTYNKNGMKDWHLGLKSIPPDYFDYNISDKYVYTDGPNKGQWKTDAINKEINRQIEVDWPLFNKTMDEVDRYYANQQTQ